MLVALNFSSEKQTVHVDLAPQGFPGASFATVLSAGGPSERMVNEIALQPYGVYIARVRPAAGK